MERVPRLMQQKREGPEPCVYAAVLDNVSLPLQRTHSKWWRDGFWGHRPGIKTWRENFLLFIYFVSSCLNFSFHPVKDVNSLPFLSPIKMQAPLQVVPLTEKGMKLVPEVQGREKLGEMSSETERPQPRRGRKRVGIPRSALPIWRSAFGEKAGRWGRQHPPPGGVLTAPWAQDGLESDSWIATQSRPLIQVPISGHVAPFSPWSGLSLLSVPHSWAQCWALLPFSDGSAGPRAAAPGPSQCVCLVITSLWLFGRRIPAQSSSLATPQQFSGNGRLEVPWSWAKLRNCSEESISAGQGLGWGRGGLDRKGAQGRQTLGDGDVLPGDSQESR